MRATRASPFFRASLSSGDSSSSSGMVSILAVEVFDEIMLVSSADVSHVINGGLPINSNTGCTSGYTKILQNSAEGPFLGQIWVSVVSPNEEISNQEIIDTSDPEVSSAPLIVP